MWKKHEHSEKTHTRTRRTQHKTGNKSNWKKNTTFQLIRGNVLTFETFDAF